MAGSTDRSEPIRCVVFGVTGHLGQELVDQLADLDWPIAELVGVASPGSVGSSFEFQGESLDVVGEWPVLKGRDLVFVCTRGAAALEIVREALRAEVPCLDCTGALAGQAEVPLALTDGVASESQAGPLAEAPLLALPSSTTLAWARVLSALGEAEVVSRIVGTVLSSASALGRHGLVSLSEESIALFNQSEVPSVGPAGQAVAFDVIPGGGIDPERTRDELVRLFGDGLGVDVASIQVPTFVGEGALLSLELSTPLDRPSFEARLSEAEGITLVPGGLGARGLVAVEEDSLEPHGPTLRDAVGSGQVLVGQIEPDRSQPEGRGWRLWVASDPLRLAADQALRVAGRRLGLA